MSCNLGWRILPFLGLAALTAGCSTLTEVDVIRVNKDSVIAALVTAAPVVPKPAPAPAALQNTRKRPKAPSLRQVPAGARKKGG